MDDIVTEFRTIDGIGEAIERRLHAAGVESWRQLAQITVALAAVRDVSSRRHIAKEAERRADATEDAESHPSEHTESFVVRVHLRDAEGVLRTHATDTPTGEEQRWQGWAPAELGDFIASHAGIAGSAAPHGRRKVIPIGRVVGGTSTRSRPSSIWNRKRWARLIGPTHWTRSGRRGSDRGAACDQTGHRANRSVARVGLRRGHVAGWCGRSDGGVGARSGSGRRLTPVGAAFRRAAPTLTPSLL